MKAKEIFVWLFIFIVGSLVVSFLVSPGSFESFVDNAKSTIPSSSPSTVNTVRLVPSEMEEYGYYASWYKTCTMTQSMGEAGGISNPKKVTCVEACGKRDMNYHSYNCDKDLFVCYCKL